TVRPFKARRSSTTGRNCFVRWEGLPGVTGAQIAPVELARTFGGVQTFVGLRSGISIALVIVVVAEMFIGSENGLGHRIINAQQVLNVKDMYASILAAGVLGYLLNVGFLVLDKRVVHWSGRA
ncbi:MAG: ABC transporter permease, partial [Burkholderiaceae bacterium]